MMKLAFSAASLLMCAASVAMAGDGRPTAWAYMDTGIKNYYSDKILGMSPDGVWPILFHDQKVWNLTPSPGFNGKDAYRFGAWQQDTTWSDTGYVRNMAVGPSWELAVSTQKAGFLYNPGRSQWVNTSGQHAPLSIDGKAPMDIAFDSLGNLYLLGSSTATGFPGTTTTQFDAIAVSSSGIVARANGEKYEYVDSQGQIQIVPISGLAYPAVTVDLAFDLNNQPHVLAYAGYYDGFYQWKAYDYDSVQQDWDITTWYGSPSVVDLKVSPRGVLGTVCLDNTQPAGSRLKYVYRNEDSWETMMLDGSAMAGTQYGLVYDRNDSPVISYVGTNGNLWIAYDPNSIPEPTSVATFAFLLFGTYHVLARQMRDPA